MIIRQTTTIVFEYPQDYVQEQEWCKTKEDRWIHKGTDTLGAVYENQISYSIGATADRKTEHRDCINCESADDCAKCRGFEDEPQTHDICTNTHECVKDTHDKTEATISKMEQVDEPQTCYTCEYEWRDGTDEPCVYCYGGSKYKPKDEPQTDCPWR